MITNTFIEYFGKDLRYARFKIEGNKYPGEVVIDAEDVCLLSKRHRWSRSSEGYVRCLVHENESMHRLILDAKSGEIVDHKNRNTSDNRRKNIRIVSHQENMMNRAAASRSLVPVKGVYLHGNRWHAEITANHKKTHLGSFEDLYDAVCARIRKETEIYGDKSIDYTPILKHIPANYLKFWFPEIYGKDSTRNASDEFVKNFFTHKKDGIAGRRYRMARLRKKARSDARFIRKKDIGIL